MKRIILILFSILAIVACDIDINIGKEPENSENSENMGSGNSSEESTLDRELMYGTWKITHAKYSEEAKLTEWEHENTYATFKENGIYKGEGHYGNGEGTYSIEFNTITAYINLTPYIKYEVLSLNKNIAEIKVTFVETEQKVWIKCEKTEKSDTEPESTISGENLYNDENMVKSAIAATYGSMRDFELYQHYIEYNALNNHRTELSVSSSLIEKAWSAAYRAIIRANTIIKGLASTEGYEWTPSYDSHARAIRAFIYYNLITLWGDVPYINENNDNMDALMEGPPRTNAMTILIEEVESVTRSINNLKDMVSGCNDFSIDAINLLLAEICLYRNDSASAKEYLNTINKDIYHESPIFCISLTDINSGMTTPSFYNKYKGLIWGENDDFVCIYHKSAIDLYMKEAEDKTASILPEWETQPQYGYWAALNRLGKAQKITGCMAHETLMPIPDSEIRINQNMTQNTGY